MPVRVGTGWGGGGEGARRGDGRGGAEDDYRRSYQGMTTKLVPFSLYLILFPYSLFILPCASYLILFHNTVLLFPY